MIHVWIAPVSHKQHISRKPAKAVANPDAVFVTLATEQFMNLLLCGTFLTQVIKVVGFLNKVTLTNIVCMNAEDAVNDTVINEG